MILWLNPVSGLSGDMLLGALLDLGAPLAAITSAITSTGLTGWRLSGRDARRAGLRAVKVDMEVDQPGPARRGGELIEIAGLARPSSVGRVAAAAVRAMVDVEARIHATSPERVHLHELGGLDTLVDTIGVAAAVHALGITEVWSAPVALGSGVVESAHGLLPVPAPATLALLASADVVGIGPVGETVTPTGAALLLALDCHYGPVPAMRLAATGYGAGSRNTPGRPNVLPAMLGTPPGHQGETIASQLLIVESTVDDVTGEMLATLPGCLMDSGALDCWITAVLGKKGRPAHVITALCPPPAAASVETALLRETGSLGARRHAVLRNALPRTSTSVRVEGHPIRVKVGPHRAKPEHDDVLAVAAATGLPARAVADLAQAAITSQRTADGEES